MSSLFFEVDCQNDFLEWAGALSVRPPVHVQANIQRIVKSNLLTFGSVDTHSFTSSEFESNGGVFPEHCVLGTHGWLRRDFAFGERALYIPTGVDDAWVEAKLGEIPNKIFMMKDELSIWSHKHAEKVMDKLMILHKIKNIFVYGVATEYCVNLAVESMFVESDEQLYIIEDAVWHVDKEEGEHCIKQWAGIHPNIKFVTTTEALSMVGSG